MTTGTDSFNRGSLVVLGLGSNDGDSRITLTKAIARISGGIGQLRFSSLYRTAPMYVLDQPDFFNAAVSGYFDGEALSLLEFINSVEAAYGRDRSREQRFGRRTLDIDILLFGNEIIDDPPKLVIPHARLNERAFALIPLLELLPQAVDPITNRPFREILGDLPDQGVERTGGFLG